MDDYLIILIVSGFLLVLNVAKIVFRKILQCITILYVSITDARSVIPTEVIVNSITGSLLQVISFIIIIS